MLLIGEDTLQVLEARFDQEWMNCKMCSVLPRQSFLYFCLIRRPFRLECLRFASSVTEHLLHGCRSLALVFEKKARDGPSKPHGVSSCVVSGSGAAWLFHQHCEVSVVIKDPNSLVRAR